MISGTRLRGAIRVALAAAALAVVAGAATTGVALWTSGVSARSEPSRAEARLARSVRNLVIRRASRGLAENPLPSTPEVLREGRAHFADHCAGCHGNDGSGHTELGRRLYPRAPDMRLPETQRSATVSSSASSSTASAFGSGAGNGASGGSAHGPSQAGSGALGFPVRSPWARRCAKKGLHAGRTGAGDL